MARLIICSAAETDYTESLLWYAGRSLDAANDFENEFDRALDQIHSDPRCFPLCDARHRFFLMRRFPYDPYYSIINRNTGDRLFSNVSSSNALFFHNHDYVLFDGSVYRTKDKEVCYTLAPGITAFALNAEETLLAVDWQNGEIAIMGSVSGEETYRATVEVYLDSQRQKSVAVVALTFSGDSKYLAAVERNLTLVDIPSQTIADVVKLGAGSREVGAPEKTSPAEVAFSANGSRLLLTCRQGDEYIYSRTRAIVF